MPLPSRPGQPPASSSTPNLAAEPATQSFASQSSDAAPTSALPAWEAQGPDYAADCPDDAGYAEYTASFPGSADPTTSFPASGTVQTSALPAWEAQGAGCTESFPGAADPTTAFPAGASHTDVLPAVRTPEGTPVRTTVMPQRPAAQPAAPPPVQPVAQPAWQPAPAPARRYEPVEPVEQEEPVRLPRPPQRRRTFALPLGFLMLLATLGLLAWGSYTFLMSVHVFDLAQGETQGLDLVAGGAVIAGAVLAFLTLITSMVAVSRSRPKTAAIALMLGAFFLPLGALAAGAYYGGVELKDRTLAEAHGAVGQVDPEQVDSYLAQVEELGIEVPWREELKEILSGQQ